LFTLNNCGHALETNSFRRHETLTKKSPWIKSKTKPAPNKKKIDEFHSDRRQKVTRARGSINSQKAKQLVLHLWMYQQSVRKKIMRPKKAEEGNITRERLPRTSPDNSSLSDSSLSETHLKPRCGTSSWVCLCFVEVRFVVFFPFGLSFVEHG